MVTEVERLGIDMRAWKQRAQTAEAQVARQQKDLAWWELRNGELHTENERLRAAAQKVIVILEEASESWRELRNALEHA